MNLVTVTHSVFTSRAAAAAAALLAVGCASSRPPAPAGPSPQRFVARTRRPVTADWSGRYLGTGETYSTQDAAWRSVPRVLLEIEPDVAGHLRVVGTVADTVRWDLDIDMEGMSPGVLSGRCQKSADDPSFTYSFSLTGAHITGVVERYPAGSGSMPETSVDQWMIDVQKQSAPSP